MIQIIGTKHSMAKCPYIPNIRDMLPEETCDIIHSFETIGVWAQ
jgi:hypothetical protein